MRFTGKTAWIASIAVLLLLIAGWAVAALNGNGGSGNSQGSDLTEQPPPAAGTDTPPEIKPAGKVDPPPPEPVIPLEKADIVMFGTEMEGMYLARAAVDEGLTVKVLDPRERIGGQLIEGEMLFLDETKDEKGRTLLQGRIKQLFDGFKSGKIRKLPEYVAYFDELRRDIPIESGITITSVKTAPPGTAGKEESVTSVDYKTKDGTVKRIEAGYWVDNTDFAALVAHLKAERMPGLEAFYGHPEQIEYMSAGMMMKFKNVDWKRFNTHFNGLTSAERSKKYGGGYVNESFAIGLSGMTNAYKPTNERVFLRGLNAVNQRDGEVLINAFLIYTIDPSDPQSIEEGLALGRKEIPLILDHFRKSIVGWEQAELNGFPNYLYIREYDHYETDYVLKPSDMLGGRMFWDNVSIAGYPLDLQGTSVNKWGNEMGRPDKYGMPLRSFLLKNYSNVILAGKNVGASAIAFGSARIQPNTGLAAESIGVILGQIHGKKQLKELTEADMPALHQLLETKYKIKLTGVTATNKLAGWPKEDIAKLDTGEIIFTEYRRR